MISKTLPGQSLYTNTHLSASFLVSLAYDNRRKAVVYHKHVWFSVHPRGPKSFLSSSNSFNLCSKVQFSVICHIDFHSSLTTRAFIYLQGNPEIRLYYSLVMDSTAINKESLLDQECWWWEIVLSAYAHRDHSSLWSDSLVLCMNSTSASLAKFRFNYPNKNSHPLGQGWVEEDGN